MNKLLLLFVPILLLAGCANNPPRTVDLPPHDPWPAAEWVTVGASNDGRPIESRQFGDGPLRVLVIGSIHGDETEGLAIINSVVHSLDSPDVRALATFRVLRDVNPDGSARRSRTNAHGIDLNRNWPASNFEPSATHGTRPLSEPETRAAHATYLAFDPDLVVVFHSTSRGPFVNFNPPDVDALAQTFADAAAATDARWTVVADMGYPTPGSLGTFSGIDRDVPTLTIEFKRGHDSDLAFRSVMAGLRAATRELSPAAR